MKWRFSVSLNYDFYSNYHNHFEVVEIASIYEMAPYITSRQWAGIVWNGDKRGQMNFMHSDFLILDFDDGQWSMEDAKKWCVRWGYTAIIGTTKNHQKPKHGLTCDRFRVAIPWLEPITQLNTFKQNMRRIAGHVPTDRQALDGARSFRPCIEIAWIQDGKGMPFRPYVEPPPKSVTIYQETGILPRWLRAMLEESPPEGTRDKHAFRLAAKLAEHGYSEQQVVDAVCAAPINLPKGDKIRAARSGYKARRR